MSKRQTSNHIKVLRGTAKPSRMRHEPAYSTPEGYPEAPAWLVSPLAVAGLPPLAPKAASRSPGEPRPGRGPARCLAPLAATARSREGQPPWRATFAEGGASQGRTGPTGDRAARLAHRDAARRCQAPHSRPSERWLPCQRCQTPTPCQRSLTPERRRSLSRGACPSATPAAARARRRTTQSDARRSRRRAGHRDD